MKAECAGCGREKEIVRRGLCQACSDFVKALADSPPIYEDVLDKSLFPELLKPKK